jgi:hypothetical protein
MPKDRSHHSLIKAAPVPTSAFETLAKKINYHHDEAEKHLCLESIPHSMSSGSRRRN